MDTVMYRNDYSRRVSLRFTAIGYSSLSKMGYVDRDGIPQAVERDVPPKSFSFDHHYLATGWSRFADLLRERGRAAAWVVRVYREATPALYMKEHEFDVRDGLEHRSRDTVWLVIDLLDGSDLEVMELANGLERFSSASAEEETS